MRSWIAPVFASLVVVGTATAQMKVPARPAGGAPTNATIGAQGAAPPGPETAARITRDSADKMVKSNQGVYVDVRSKDKYEEGHIPGSLNIPLSQLMSRVAELPPGKVVITYCACVQEHSAAVAVVRLNQHGIQNAAALLGGWNAWTAAHLPVETGASKVAAHH